VIDEKAADHLGAEREEMRSIIALNAPSLNQLDVGFVGECAGLHDVPGDSRRKCRRAMPRISSYTKGISSFKADSSPLFQAANSPVISAGPAEFIVSLQKPRAQGSCGARFEHAAKLCPKNPNKKFGIGDCLRL
jgi:hypothetical protein